jgi:hypothetical protein
MVSLEGGLVLRPRNARLIKAALISDMREVP